MAGNQMIDGSGIPTDNPMMNNIADMVSNITLSAGLHFRSNVGQTPTSGIVGVTEVTPDGSGTIDPNLLAIQQMHALEDIGWKGGENYYDGKHLSSSIPNNNVKLTKFPGPHDDFCFLCGSSQNLFACTTCETSYHSRCMTPSLDPNEVPAFWFCPHCVNNELHIPPSMNDEHFFAPLPSSLPSYPLESTPTSESFNTQITMSRHQEPPVYGEKSKQPIRQQPTPPGPAPPSPVKPPAKSQETPQSSIPTTQKKQGRQRNSSPPRKKSKYSAFSKEVDKALSVIYNELETAAGYGRSEGNLESKVQALEQQLKMQEGQMMLSSKELEVARKELAREREQGQALKMENEMLRALVDRKENELKEWRKKLRSMIGSELE